MQRRPKIDPDIHDFAKAAALKYGVEFQKFFNIIVPLGIHEYVKHQAAIDDRIKEARDLIDSVEEVRNIPSDHIFKLTQKAS